MENNKRFVLTTAEAIGEEPDSKFGKPTKWWLDTARPIGGEPGGFIAVQTYADKDPNDFVQVGDSMGVLFTDQAEYYFVCDRCYQTYAHMQWSGSTKAAKGWMERARAELLEHKETKGWCEFCDPIFGNGGWI
ncbi:hypothetical protein [Salmonirosea aquatica]|uniref:Uncharacterized protein n=1 Tax=Salmonirosea aquatica TaxID=2654236 RepID=A0A7C9BMT7_9BACT|nr:hypothetical protein [Cytophagaceae bacterium SJW1-29]